MTAKNINEIKYSFWRDMSDFSWDDKCQIDDAKSEVNGKSNKVD